MDWLLENPILNLLEAFTPDSEDVIDNEYVENLQQFITDAHIENEEHFLLCGSYRMDLFIIGEYAFMKLRTYVEGNLDPDSSEGQTYMTENYWTEFTETLSEFTPSSSDIIIVQESVWQNSLIEEYI